MSRIDDMLGARPAREVWTVTPPLNTVVQVDMMRHMPVDPLPGGLYAVVVNLQDMDQYRWGSLMIVSVPRSLTAHPRYGEWQWDQTFPFFTNPSAEDHVRLLHVPDLVEAAVLALVNLSDTLPVVVDDGWLC